MIAASLVVGLGALLAVASASAAWTPHFNVAKQHVRYSLVEMDRAGDAVFVWTQPYAGAQAIYTRARSANGAFSPVRRIAGDSGSYDLAVDADGDAYYVWTHGDSSGRQHLRTRVRLADGTLGPVQTLKSVEAGKFIQGTVGVDASGAAVYAWAQGRQDEPELLQARARSPSGTLGPTRNIARGNALAMAVDASGNATLGWNGGEARAGMFTRILAANGDLGPVRRVSRAGAFHAADRLSDRQLVVAPNGRALFAWDEYDSDSRTYRVLVRARSADGDFQPPQVVVAGKPNDVQPYQPGLQVGIGPTGKGVIAWPTGDAWRARTRAPGGALGPVRTVVPSFVGYWIDLGIDSQGNIVFAWTRIADGGKYRVFVRSEGADGTLGPTRALSLAGYDALWLDLAVNPAGDATAVWQAGSQGFAIHASFGP